MIRKVALKQDKEYITLSQLLKTEGFVGSGGEVRFFLEQNHVFVNDEREMRRGKKIYVGDRVLVDDVEIEIVGA